MSAEFAHDCADELFGIAEQHEGVVEVVEGIVDAGKTRLMTMAVWASLDDRTEVLAHFDKLAAPDEAEYF